MRARHKSHEEVHPSQPAGDGAVAAEDPILAEEPVATELELLREERDDLQQQLLRTLAEMQNMRKRLQSESQQLRQFATEDLVRELLPVLDNFERTLVAAEQGANLETVIEGVKAVDRQLRSALERRSVTRIKAHGEAFNPDLHEAIATDESHEHPEGTITGEIEPGYKMAEKVIRPARVRVSRKP